MTIHTTAALAAHEISGFLADQIEDLAIELLGDPTDRKAHQWRWGNRGSMSLELGGDRRGKWHWHESGTGGDALELVRHFACGGDRKAAYKWALGWLQIDASKPLPPRIERPALQVTPRDDARRISFALQIWDAASPVQGSPVETYLASRKLMLPATDALRFHPRCPRGADERLPAMVALMRDPMTGESRGIHRTFLMPDGTGKIDHGTAKMMLGACGGAVVMLADNADVINGLGIAEGIETSLAIIQNGFEPMWAAGSAGTISTFPVLPEITDLSIFADHDAGGAGQNAAKQCAMRWQASGRHVRVLLPKQGFDWADVAARKAVA